MFYAHGARRHSWARSIMDVGALTAWRCVAEWAAERRRADVLRRVFEAVPPLGRRALPTTSDSGRTWYAWVQRQFVQRTCNGDVTVTKIHGRLHSVGDEPAICGPTVASQWFWCDQLHRRGAPAIETADGLRVFYEYGKQHRADGPAKIERDGSLFYYWHGALHRLDGPAIERADGSYAWFHHGVRHRPRGPAVRHADGTLEAWVRGRRVPMDRTNRVRRRGRGGQAALAARAHGSAASHVPSSELAGDRLWVPLPQWFGATLPDSPPIARHFNDFDIHVEFPA